MSWEKTYITQIVDYKNGNRFYRHLIIERRDGKPITANWDVLQKIKNDCLGEDVLAIEFYPEETAVVNEINRRHLWEIDRDILNIGFRR